ncbi:MAG: GHKL domain-containing protein [Bdellovibrionaceae bacterium]|nr:GHKL domain-containing protein [Pseudobdellovibrionaceae bacterium]
MLLTALCLGITFYVIGEKFLRNLAVQELSRSSRQALFIVENFFINRKAEQATLAKSTFFFRTLDRDTIHNRFEDYRRGYRMYQDISFYDHNRIRQIDLNQLDLGVKSNQDDLFNRADRTSGPVYSFNVENPLRPAVLFATRVQQAGRPKVGYVVAAVPLGRLQNVLLPLSEPLSQDIRADIQIFARDGTRIYSRLESGGHASPEILGKPGSSDLRGEPRKLANGGLLYETQDAFTVLFERIADSDFESSWKLAFRVMKADIERPIAFFRNLMIGVFVALLLLAFALNRWLSESMLTPIEALTRSMHAIGSGRIDSIQLDRGAQDRKDEIGVLSRGLSDMTEKMKENFAELSSASKFVALGEMAAGIAHEINNPLTVIMGKAALLEAAAKSGDNAEMRESSQKIIEMVSRISKTIHGLRSYSRSGETDPVGAENLKNIIDSTLDICQERIRLNQIKVSVDIEPLDSTIIARPVQVSQILMNLINNAFDAITLSHPPLEADERWLRIEVREDPQWVYLSVENGGPSIPPEIADQLFKPFFTTKPQGRGTGIGLTISRRLAETNDARLFLDRDQPCTRFTIQFPRPTTEND